jgi:hypothetical protein
VPLLHLAFHHQFELQVVVLVLGVCCVGLMRRRKIAAVAS